MARSGVLPDLGFVDGLSFSQGVHRSAHAPSCVFRGSSVGIGGEGSVCQFHDAEISLRRGRNGQGGGDFRIEISGHPRLSQVTPRLEVC